MRNGQTWRRRLALTWACATAVLAGQSAAANTIYVTTTAQKISSMDGCSLQEAIYSANFDNNLAIDALVEAVVALLVILEFLDDRLELSGLGLALVDGLFPLVGDPLLEEPVAGRGERAEDEQAEDEDVVEVGRPRRRGSRNRRRGSGSRSADRPPFPHEIDLDQASPNFLMASPTAIAMLGAISASSSGLN